MCALTAGQRGSKVLLLDHADRVGAKILISGGGRCNFTNLHSTPDRFLSGNADFCRSALGRYTQADFISLVERHSIPYHEKTLGQLFCDGSAREIVAMLLAECAQGGVDVRVGYHRHGYFPRRLLPFGDEPRLLHRHGARAGDRRPFDSENGGDRFCL